MTAEAELLQIIIDDKLAKYRERTTVPAGEVLDDLLDLRSEVLAHASAVPEAVVEP